MKKYNLALHIFRRDLRLQDNTALIDALKSSSEVIPCFIFDKRQIEENDYKSDHCIQFMVNSLHELDEELGKKNSKLYVFYGNPTEVVADLIATLDIQAVYVNRDYTPFSRERDQHLADLCAKHQVDFHSYADALLHEPEQVHKADGKPYTVFTPFFRRSQEIAVNAPVKNTFSNYFHGSIQAENKNIFKKLSQLQNPNLLVKGGRKEGLALLKELSKLANYADIRNLPAVHGTTTLSAHNKFGTISIREFYATVVAHFGKSHTLISELYWRDFFSHIGFHFPHVYSGAFHPQYDGIEWSTNEKKFRAWCEGMTGFPIVDAGMRELNTTGFMHNRVRMIVASFLVKDLHINWRWGEKYFAQKLVDYDAAVNNGNWQWAASTGCDAQPYFRIFNPWLQQQKFDPDCLYIKRWIPELAHIPVKTIHALNAQTTRLMTNYPDPIVDHALESQKAKAIYKAAASK